MIPIIKVGFLLSYDYKFLKISLPFIYEDADTITLAVDKNCRTWAGNSFAIETSFFEWLSEFDTKKKITIYEDDFCIPNLSPMENETRQRNMMSNFMGQGGWHIQIDADEYFIDFHGFVNLLKSKQKYLLDPQRTPITIIANWLVLYKKSDDGFLFVEHDPDPVHIATNFPRYETARTSSHPKTYTNFFLVHQTWAREEEEVWQKIKNWGHKNDFDTDEYFAFWKSINELNYGSVKNFHPVNATMWKSLGYSEGKTIQKFIENYQKHNKLSISAWRLWLKNNPRFERQFNRIMRLKNKIFRQS